MNVAVGIKKMTVLSEEGDDCLVGRPPPRKRLCLSTSKKVAAETPSASSSTSVTYQMAASLDTGNVYGMQKNLITF